MNGVILHSHDITTGIRKIEWMQEVDGENFETFYAKINGRVSIKNLIFLAYLSQRR